MRQIALLLCFIPTAIAEGRQVREWIAEIDLAIMFPTGVRAPASVTLKEPGDGVITEPRPGHFRVTSAAAYSHVLLEISAPGFIPERRNSANNRLFQWANGVEAYRDVVQMRVEAIPAVRTPEYVKDSVRGCGLRIPISNPYPRELVLTSILFSGSAPKPPKRSKPHFSSSDFALELSIEGRSIRGLARERSSSPAALVKGSYFDSGTRREIGFSFNPNFAVGERQSGQIDVFVDIKSSELIELGIGASGPPMPPPRDVFREMTEWEIILTFDNQIVVTQNVSQPALCT